MQIVLARSVSTRVNKPSKKEGFGNGTATTTDESNR
ncbi:hypothetical protein JOC48_001773 [Aquibacillus albus]|uniref:Uncharacterized protein n=1 Tax=Aquibacillus albus TaxID=1168171 RepID=A0ABS2MZG8_9BACI|nr:hypothetical protein [Aquibacillus albus]